MRILLFILKILGILLLVILFLTILLIFYPVSYRFEGTIDEEISLHGCISWLFRIIRFEFDMENYEMKPKLGVLGFEWNLGEGNSSAEDSSGEFQKEAEAKETKEPLRKKDEEVKETKKTTDFQEETEANGSVESRKGVKLSQKDEYAKSSVKEAAPKPPRESMTAKRKYKSDWKKRLGSVKSEFTDERNKRAVSHLWQEVLYLLLHLKPKYVQAEITFSVGDPAATGQVTGILSLLPIVYQYDAHVYPDFLSEEFYIRGNFQLKGHMALYHFIRCFFRVWKDKNLQRLFYKFRK